MELERNPQHILASDTCYKRLESPSFSYVIPLKFELGSSLSC